MKRYIILLIISVIVPNMLMADIFAKSGTAGLQFLKIGIDARAIGMGEAYTAVTDDISSIYWNPAGLALKPQSQLLLSHTEWLADIKYEYAAFSVPFSFGTMALSAAVLHMDYMDVMTEEQFGPNGEEFTCSDMSIGLTYASAFTDKFSFGVTAKYLRENLDESDVNGFSIDLGSLYNTGWKNLTIGMSLRNFGPNLRYELDNDGDGELDEDTFDLLDNDGDGMIDEDREELDFKIPMNFSLGISGDIMRSGNQHLIGSLQLDNNVDRSETYNLGFEYKIGIFKMRAGYQFGYDSYTYSGGFGCSIPASFAVVDLDYSYTNMGDLTESWLETPHRVSLKLFF